MSGKARLSCRCVATDWASAACLSVAPWASTALLAAGATCRFVFVRCALVAACLAVVGAPAEAAGTLLSAVAGFWLLLATDVFVAGCTALDEELAFGSAATDELDWSTGATEDELVLLSATFEDELDLAFVAFDDELVLATVFVDELDLEELDEDDFDEELDELESTAELDDELNELEAEDELDEADEELDELTELDDELADELDEELTADELDEEDDTTAKFSVTFPVVTPIPIMLAHGSLAVFGWPDSEVAAGTSEW